MSSSDLCPRQQMHGFTLVELMVTIVILAILTMAAIPSFSRLFTSNRLATQTNEFKAALQSARSEAQRRGAVRGTSLRATSGTENYAPGWQVFTDDGLNGTLDSGDTLLRQQDAPPAGTTTTIRRVLRAGAAGAFTYSDATAPADRMVVTFNTQGQNMGSAPAFFRICDSAMPTVAGRIIQVSIAGIVTLDSSTTVCP